MLTKSRGARSRSGGGWRPKTRTGSSRRHEDHLRPQAPGRGRGRAACSVARAPYTRNGIRSLGDHTTASLYGHQPAAAAARRQIRQAPAPPPHPLVTCPTASPGGGAEASRLVLVVLVPRPRFPRLNRAPASIHLCPGCSPSGPRIIYAFHSIVAPFHIVHLTSPATVANVAVPPSADLDRLVHKKPRLDRRRGTLHVVLLPSALPLYPIDRAHWPHTG